MSEESYHDNSANQMFAILWRLGIANQCLDKSHLQLMRGCAATWGVLSPNSGNPFVFAVNTLESGGTIQIEFENKGQRKADWI